jgi:hypothetical protein
MHECVSEWYLRVCVGAGGGGLARGERACAAYVPVDTPVSVRLCVNFFVLIVARSIAAVSQRRAATAIYPKAKVEAAEANKQSECLFVVGIDKGTELCWSWMRKRACSATAPSGIAPWPGHTWPRGAKAAADEVTGGQSQLGMLHIE